MTIKNIHILLVYELLRKYFILIFIKSAEPNKWQISLSQSGKFHSHKGCAAINGANYRNVTNNKNSQFKGQQ